MALICVGNSFNGGGLAPICGGSSSGGGPWSRRRGGGSVRSLCGHSPGGGGGVRLGNGGGIRISSLPARGCITGLGGGTGDLGRSGNSTVIGVRGPDSDGGGGRDAYALGSDLGRDNLGRGSGSLDARDPCASGRGTRDHFDEGDHDAAGGLGRIDSCGNVVSVSRGGPSGGATLGTGGIVLGDSSDSVKMSAGGQTGGALMRMGRGSTVRGAGGGGGGRVANDSIGGSDLLGTVGSGCIGTYNLCGDHPSARGDVIDLPHGEDEADSVAINGPLEQ